MIFITFQNYQIITSTCLQRALPLLFLFSLWNDAWTFRFLAWQANRNFNLFNNEFLFSTLLDNVSVIILVEIRQNHWSIALPFLSLMGNSENRELQKYFWNFIVLQGKAIRHKKLNHKQQSLLACGFVACLQYHQPDLSCDCL